VAAAVLGICDRSSAQSLEAQLKNSRGVRGVEARKHALRRLAAELNKKNTKN
jgi:hypothetical protein